jgi:hypothetical protein
VVGVFLGSRLVFTTRLQPSGATVALLFGLLCGSRRFPEPPNLDPHLIQSPRGPADTTRLISTGFYRSSLRDDAIKPYTFSTGFYRSSLRDDAIKPYTF